MAPGAGRARSGPHRGRARSPPRRRTPCPCALCPPWPLISAFCVSLLQAASTPPPTRSTDRRFAMIGTAQRERTRTAALPGRAEAAALFLLAPALTLILVARCGGAGG